MNKSYQEKILDSILERAGDKEISGTAVLMTMKDLFAIDKLETRIGSLAGPAHYNDRTREEMKECYKELKEILGKYEIKL